MAHFQSDTVCRSGYFPIGPNRRTHSRLLGDPKLIAQIRRRPNRVFASRILPTSPEAEDWYYVTELETQDLSVGYRALFYNLSVGQSYKDFYVVR